MNSDISNMIKTDFSTALPEETGISSESILKFLQILEKNQYSLHACMIFRHNKLCFSAAADPYTVYTPHRMFSAAKSVIMINVLFALQEKLFTVDDSVYGYFSDLIPAENREIWSKMKIKNLLTMSTGQTDEPFPLIFENTDADLISPFFLKPVIEKPGTKFRYNNTVPHIICALIERASGIPYKEYQEKHLCIPLGIDIYAPVNSKGQYNPILTSMSAAALMKTAVFLLQRGKWKGQQLLDSALVDSAVTCHIKTDLTGNGGEYGWQIWLNRFGGYRMDGGWGQYAVILPREDISVVLLSDMTDSSFALKTLEKEILGRLCFGSGLQGKPAEENGKNLYRYTESWSLLPQEINKPSSSGICCSQNETFRYPPEGIYLSEFCRLKIETVDGKIKIEWSSKDTGQTVLCGVNGQWVENEKHWLVLPEKTIDNGVWNQNTDTCLMSAFWKDRNILDIYSKSFGAMGFYYYRMHFEKDSLNLSYTASVCRGMQKSEKISKITLKRE
jgi:CubicO group peptidase (beta-lactamase class C family)